MCGSSQRPEISVSHSRAWDGDGGWSVTRAAGTATPFSSSTATEKRRAVCPPCASDTRRARAGTKNGRARMSGMHLLSPKSAGSAHRRENGTQDLSARGLFPDSHTRAQLPGMPASPPHVDAKLFGCSEEGWPAHLREGLFLSQRDHRIDARGAACWDVTGRERDQRQKNRDACIRERPPGVATPQHALLGYDGESCLRNPLREICT